ncbi:SRPBCC domain-containing protein [Devosia sp.]|uniref:SRPBCC domain-containing protein n=1 Tax=Devosia sp. TaxID=1871048 RepID=UPI0032645464
MLTELTEPTEQEKVLVITRTFKAPRRLMWQAFAEPYHLAQWWGPEGYSNPVCEMDFRVGGHWHHVMRGPDGRDLPTDNQFIEIVEPERIVYRNAPAKGAVWGENPPPGFLRTITFAEQGAAETLLTIRAEFDSVADRDTAVRRGWVEGTHSSFAKLDLHLNTMEIAP